MFIYFRLSLLQIPITTSKWRGIFAYNATKPLFGNTSINLMHKYVLVDFIIAQVRQRKKKAGRYQRDCKMHLHDLGWGKKVQWPWTLICEEITVVYDCSFICTLSNLSIRLQFIECNGIKCHNIIIQMWWYFLIIFRCTIIDIDIIILISII